MRLLALPHRWAKRPEPGHGNLRLPDRPALLARRASSRRAGQTCSVRKGRIRLAIAFASATPLAARAQWRPSSRQLAPTPASPPASVGGRRPVGPGGEADARSTPRQQHRRRANACSEAVAAAPHDCSAEGVARSHGCGRGKGIAGSWPVVTIALKECDLRDADAVTRNGAAGLGRSRQQGRRCSRRSTAMVMSMHASTVGDRHLAVAFRSGPQAAGVAGDRAGKAPRLPLRLTAPLCASTTARTAARAKRRIALTRITDDGA